MRRVILNESNFIAPFNEPARDLRILNKPLWLYQRDALERHITEEREVFSGLLLDVPEDDVEQIVYRDNLFFTPAYIDAFMSEAKAGKKAVRAAFSIKDAAFREHALPLSTMFEQSFDNPDIYYADMWYFPHGVTTDVEPLIIDSDSREIGYYWVPSYMAVRQGDMTFNVPLRGCLSIESWVHIFIADAVFGLFARGAQAEDRLAKDLKYMLKVFWRSLVEFKQVLRNSELVTIGKNCSIDPTAIINGPCVIGDNVSIGAGAVIDNSIIGNNVNISQGCQVQLSVVGDGCFMPFRSALWMTTLMENSMVAQNTCLQMCVVGRNTFIGAGSTFTDYNLLPRPIKALSGDGTLEDANRDVLGGCVGHNCRIGSGMIVYPARVIESDTVLFATHERRVIARNVDYDNSDHHGHGGADLHQRLYPREGENINASW